MQTRHFLIPLAALAFAASAMAQTSIFRCGNTYTNDRAEAQSKGCKLVEGGNVTVVEGTRVNGAASASASRETREKTASAPRSAASPQRIGTNEQRTRDAEARTILEAELKKAEARQAELLKEFNNGAPEKMGPEHRNHQKYLDRVAELKASIERNEKDIAGIKRELTRAGNTAAN